MIARLTDLLPPDARDFEKIAKAYVSKESESLVLVLKEQGYQELLETLSIFRDKLDDRMWWWTFSKVSQEAYRFYLANTQGEIPTSDDVEKASFNVLDWISQYCKELGCEYIKEPKSNADAKEKYPLMVFGPRKTCIEEHAFVEGESSAITFRKLARTVNQLRYGKDLATPPHIFPFDTESGEYSHQNAIWMSDFALISYFQPGLVENQIKQWKYKSFKWIEDKESDTQCFFVEKEDHVVLCFRGTSSFKDALVDMKISKIEEGTGNVKIHKGFGNALSHVWQDILSHLDSISNQKKIFVCGHSLGGALAILGAFRLSQIGYKIGGVYTLGAPRIGNKTFARKYQELLAEVTYLLINNKDIVPQIPPEIFGFRHVGAVKKQFGLDHHLIEEPQTRSLSPHVSGISEEPRELTAYELGQMEQQLMQAMSTDMSLREDVDEEAFEPTSTRGLIDDHSVFEYIYKVGVNALEKSLGKESVS